MVLKGAEQDLVPLVLEHATEGEKVKISVPPSAIITDVKQALVEQLGWGKVLEVSIVMKMGTLLAQFRDSDRVYTDAEVRKQKNRKSWIKQVLVQGISFKEPPPEEPPDAVQEPADAVQEPETAPAPAKAPCPAPVREAEPAITGDNSRPSVSGIWWPADAKLSRSTADAPSVSASFALPESPAQKSKNSQSDFEPASPKRRAVCWHPSSPRERARPVAGSGSCSPVRSLSPRSLSPLPEAGGALSKKPRKRRGLLVRLPGDMEPGSNPPQPFDAVFSALDRVASPRHSPTSSPSRSPTRRHGSPQTSTSNSQSQSPLRTQQPFGPVEPLQSAVAVSQTASEIADSSSTATVEQVKSLPESAAADSSTAAAQEAARLDLGVHEAVSIAAAADEAAKRVQAPVRSIGIAAEEPGSDSFRIALMTNGTRGDVQPMIALALALEQCRHNACLFIPHNLLGLCKEYAVNAVPVFGNNKLSIKRAGGVGGFGIHESVRSQHEVIRRSKEELDKWLKANPGACVPVDDALADFRPAAIILGCLCDPPAFRHQTQFRVPVIPLLLNHKDLSERTHRDLQPPRPVLYAVSEEIDPEPLEGPWPKRTGPMVVKQNLPKKLLKVQEFIQAGTPPVVMGWGSMQPASVTPVQMLALALRTLMEGWHRGIILGGWAGLDKLGSKLLTDGDLEGLEDSEELAAYARGKVCFVESVPHDWLLDRCSCFVHHGGAGTVQSALRAGIPQVITPIWHDQYDSAQRVEQMRVGFGCREFQFNEITPEVLASKVAQALHCHAAAMHAKTRLADENGAKRGASIVDVFLKVEVATGLWSQAQDSILTSRGH